MRIEPWVERQALGLLGLDDGPVLLEDAPAATLFLNWLQASFADIGRGA